MWDRVAIRIIENGLREDGEVNIDNIKFDAILRISHNKTDRLILFKQAIENVLQDIKSENGKEVLDNINKYLAR
jgi:hypothetical protein